MALIFQKNRQQKIHEEHSLQKADTEGKPIVLAVEHSMGASLPAASTKES